MPAPGPNGWLRRTRRGGLAAALAMLMVALMGLCIGTARTFAAEPAPRVDFARQIRPILAEQCFECHGPDPRGRKGKLRLDTRDGLLADRGGYRTVVPGQPEESELIARILAEDPDERMPPPGSRRTLTPAQIELFRAWVAQGAEWNEHWAFAPPVRPKIPEVSAAEGSERWCLNPIDRFILARLDREGLSPAPEADRATLIRRLSLDLLGLPPQPSEVEEFQGDDRLDAYERLVDRLLASPHFGERLGRQWLDLARYADSDGYEDDFARPDAWRYRDWVIAALNADMPFDEFTIVQLAGDLLPGASYEQRLAAGFQRMNLFNRSAVGRDNEEEFRTKTAKDRANTTATVWLGLTMGCAECHTHKYDPLPHRDYYRFYAFFDNLTDRELAAPRLPDAYTRAHAQAVREFEAGQAQARAALAAYQKTVMPPRQAAWERERLADPGELPAEIAAIVRIAADQRSDEQARLLAGYFLTVDPEAVRLKAAVLDNEMAKNNRPLPPSTKALSVSEAATPRPTYVHLRGDYLSPGEAVTPGTPAFLPPLATRGERPDRLDMARWLVDGRNPLVGRVAVNLLWQQLFGRGLVATAENFGLQGEPPSHPELLDWLAAEFAASGWSRKAMIRLIVTSATYRQSSRRRADLDLDRRDPGNVTLARQNRFRVEAEIVRDLGLAVSGLLEPRLGGPSIQPPLPASLAGRLELKSERVMPPSQGADRYRRGVYVNVQRTLSYPMLKDFDAADSSAPCTRRERSNTPQQALSLLNDPVFSECARGLGLIVARACGNDLERGIALAFRRCLARPPGEKEAAVLRQVYDAHRSLYAADGAATAELLGGEPLPPGVSAPKAAAWIAVGRTLLNLDEFLTRE